MKTTIGKLHPGWIKEMRKEFRSFLRMTGFPEPTRNGHRGPEFEYPEWQIMFIAVLSVKAKVKSYTGIHALTERYWQYIRSDKNQRVISETNLRDRLKKICHFPGKPARFIFQIFSPEIFAKEKQETKKEKIGPGKRR